MPDPLISKTLQDYYKNTVVTRKSHHPVRRYKDATRGGVAFAEMMEVDEIKWKKLCRRALIIIFSFISVIGIFTLYWLNRLF